MQVFETIEMAFLRCFVWVSLPIILHTNRNLGNKLGLCIIQSNRRTILFSIHLELLVSIDYIFFSRSSLDPNFCVIFLKIGINEELSFFKESIH